jgi:tRNA(Ile)-lysidine synthase
VEWFDANKVKPPITVRFRQKGDRFWPLGLADKKKTGKFLTDTKVPQQIRRKTLIIADSEKIIWLWPVRISEQVKITDKTQEILRLQIIGLYDT